MSYTFKDRVVLITGGNSGIGLACVQKFLTLGAKVVATGRRALTALNQLSTTEKDALETADYQCCDVSRPDDIANLFAYIEKTYGRLDVAVNNAGIAGTMGKMLTDFSADEYQAVMDTNVRGVWLCMQHEVQLMLPKAVGCIINTSSIAGLKANRAGPLYAMSKFAVSGLTRTAALQYAKSGIRINAVCPGLIDTPILPPGMAEQLGSLYPMGRAGQPMEIAHAVAWLASDEASFVTGVTVPVDGGMLA